jgi:hypothetical protein
MLQLLYHASNNATLFPMLIQFLVKHLLWRRTTIKSPHKRIPQRLLWICILLLRLIHVLLRRAWSRLR